MLPTGSQKNTAYAYAKQFGIDPIEGYGIRLTRHFVDDVAPVTGARVELEEYAWARAVVDGAPHDHTWVRFGPEVRTAAITVTGAGATQRVHVVGGVKDLVVLKSTGSEFAGFLTDPYTTLAPTDDRITATSLVARWRFTSTDVDWDAVYGGVRQTVVDQFATSARLGVWETRHRDRSRPHRWPAPPALRQGA